jgi:hypothetical protein
MTTFHEAGLRISPQLLYLAIDLGERPPLRMYNEQVGALTRIAAYAIEVAETATALADERIVGSTASHVYIPSSARLPDTRVIRTSLSSPWLTVLGSVAETSRPIAYSLAGLFSLQRLLVMMMAYQRHRLYVEERRALMRRHAEGELQERDVDPAEPEAHNAVSELLDRSSIMAGAIDKLGPVLEAEIIEADDPRATGTG